jgi:N-acetylneuraminic acid mutarotase
MLPATTLSARVLAAAVWTGSEVIVWGGGDALGTVDRGDGARYNPQTNTWSTMSSVGAPSARRGAHAFWTGSKVLLWSGLRCDGTVAERGVVYLYDPVTDLWSLGGSAGVQLQEDLRTPQVAWTGTSLFVYGGFRDGIERDVFYEYDAVAQQWYHPLDGPTDRNGSLGGWDGSGFVAWGGMNDTNILPDGKRWVPNATPERGVWNDIASNPAKQRWAAPGVAGWPAAIGGGKLLLFGGANTATSFVTDVLRYDSNTDTWTTLGAWPSASAHVSGVGVWTGQEMILWSGRPTAAGAVTTQGERYRP